VPSSDRLRAIPHADRVEQRAYWAGFGLRDAKPHVCILCGVTRLNVYLPDDLAAEAKKAGLNLSAVTQEAIRRSLALRSTDAWLETLASPTARVSHDRALAALDAARDEAPTRHG